MKHEMFSRAAMVCESFVQTRQASRYQMSGYISQPEAELENGNGQKKLLDHIRDAVPELKADEIEKAVAFHEVTDKDLLPCYFVTGDTLKWNDVFIPKGHPARKHCGEGPFKVVRDESYLVAFVLDCNNRIKSDIKTGNGRLVLLNLSTFGLVIAHGSFFVELKKSSI